jgi:hypothetical protein
MLKMIIIKYIVGIIDINLSIGIVFNIILFD